MKGTGADVQLASANAQDFPVVRELAAAIWRQHYTGIISPEQIDSMLAGRFNDQALRSHLDATEKWLEVLWWSNQAVGYCSYEFSGDPPGALKVGQLYVLASHRGQGLGRYMLGHIESRAAELGRRNLVLQVNKRNTSAIGFYRAEGFEIVKEVVFDIGAGFVMDDYVMAKKVESAAIDSITGSASLRQ